MNKSSMNRPTDDILMSFATGNCTEQELRLVNEWAAQDEANVAELNALIDTHIRIAARGVANDGRQGQAWMRLQQRIAEEKAAQKTARRRAWIRRVAAVFVGLLVVSGVTVAYMSWLRASSMILAEAPVGKVSRIVLADGTRVWLNSGSTLRYPKAFDGKEREVELDGEAYFEVAHDARHPFLVDSRDMNVRVLGTKFNFRNLSERSATVSLVEGSVEVKGNHGEGCVRLRPGQQAIVSPQSQGLSVKTTRASLVASWHDNILPCSNANIDDIADALEFIYGMKGSVDADFDHESTYSGDIRKKSTVDSTLRTLQLSIPMRYTINGNTIRIHR